jgi:prepilin-type N-terminal cleavage/methylation domain-containing protein
MRLTKSANQNRSGFTLIEVLMAVLLIAILATIAITQFTNFARDTRNATTKENLGILRNAIQKHFGTMRLRCNVLNGAYPNVTDLNSNDITKSGMCTSTDVPEITDRYFVAGGIPENPWSGKTCNQSSKRNIVDTSDYTDAMNIGINLDSGTVDSATTCGWVYDSINGRIKAATRNNGTDRDSYYESAY